MVKGFLSLISGLNGSNSWLLVHVMTERTMMMRKGTPHQMTSAKLLWSQSGEYFALLFPARNFHAKRTVITITGTTTMHMSKRETMIRLRSLPATHPLGFKTIKSSASTSKKTHSTITRARRQNKAILKYFFMLLFRLQEGARIVYKKFSLKRYHHSNEKVAWPIGPHSGSGDDLHGSDHPSRRPAAHSKRIWCTKTRPR